MNRFILISSFLLFLGITSCFNEDVEVNKSNRGEKISKDSLTKYSLEIISSIDSAKWIPISFDSFEEYSFVTLSTEDTSLMGCHSCVADITVIGFYWGDNNKLVNIDTLIYLPISSVWGQPPKLSIKKLVGQFVLIAAEKDGAGGEHKEWVEVVPLTGCNSGEVALSWEASTGYEQTYFNANSLPADLKDSIKTTDLTFPITASYNSTLSYKWEEMESMFSIWKSQQAFIIIPTRKSRKSPIEIKLPDLPLKNFVFDGCQWTDRSIKGI